ncbi:hypothetical protein [Luteolibacter sp. Populi]|uniref:hypothetical protein n=1 Tax=Luteolibacter sp. Populi TaxID=3230487 RepID=UPI0034668E49
MSDPFEDFLEEALGTPDLELGHDMRRRLLQAAVADEKTGPLDNVIAMDRGDPDLTAGFAWLVGEAPATSTLMGRMVADQTFLETLDGERYFLRTLRASLRCRTAATVPPARRTWIPAVAMSAAAALALAAGALFWSPAQAPATAVATTGSSAPAGRGETTASATPPAVSTALESSGTAAAPGSPATENIASLDLPSLPEPRGTGRSLDPGDPLLTGPRFDTALALAAAEAIVPEPILATLGGGMAGGYDSTGDPEMALASLSGTSSAFTVGGMSTLGGGRGGSSATGPSLIGSGDGGGRDGSIPEPGGALPVMLGFLILLLKRPKRAK